MRCHQHILLLLRHDSGLVLREAIAELVTPSSLVIDAGAGSGMLSILAAKAGAGRVWAVDLEPLDTAGRLAQANRCGDLVTCVRADLASWTPPERVDLLIALVYINDPRRDIAQSEIVASLASRALKPGGNVLPDRVTYSATLLDWPDQDFPSRCDRLARDVQNITGRYGVDASPLEYEALAAPNPAWLPVRDSDGTIDRSGSRVLSDDIPVWDVRYDGSEVVPPASLSIEASRAGVANVVLWTQRLWWGDRLVFANESVSWLLEPRAVSAGESIPMELGASWRATNVIG